MFISAAATLTAARRDAAKGALENAQKLQPNSPETLLAFGYYQYWVLRDYELAKTTFGLVRKALPANSEVLQALGAVTRREGAWNESVAYWEEALALDPRNPELLSNAAFTYAILRQFPTALKLYDRALDLVPNDLDLMAIGHPAYQAQGNLHERGKLLMDVDAQTPSGIAFGAKLAQLRLERNHARPFDCYRPDSLNFPLVLRWIGVLIKCCWLWRSAWPAIGLRQELRLNRRVTHWSRSSEINQITPILW